MTEKLFAKVDLSMGNFNKKNPLLSNIVPKEGKLFKKMINFDLRWDVNVIIARDKDDWKEG